MSPIRYRDEDPSFGGIILGLAVGALAGFAVGAVVAQEAGGIPGVVKHLRRGLAMLEDEIRGADLLKDDEDDEFGEDELDDDVDDELDDAVLDEDELDEDQLDAGDAAMEHAMDEVSGSEEDIKAGIAARFDATLPPAEALEVHVLDALEDDPVLSERAIDIGAIRDGVIELSGFVSTEEEAAHAARVVKNVAGVDAVVNRLQVENG